MSADGGGLEPRVLRSSRLRTTLLLIVSVFALGIGVAAVAGGEKNGWLIVAVGALLTIFMCLLLLRPQRLELDEKGLTTVNPLGKRWSVEWRECGTFRTAYPVALGSSTHTSAQVVFECEESERSLARSLITHMVAGGSASLPDTYGMSAKNLATLLNRYREAAVGQDAGG